MSEQDHSLHHRPTLVRTPSYDRLIQRFHKYLTNNEGGVIDHPIRYIEDHKLIEFLKPLHKKLNGLVTLEELEESAKLAKQEHSLSIGQPVAGLTEAEMISIRIQRSSAFWHEPKDLIVTLVACCLASMVQGWDQVANGNLGWPHALGILVDPRDPMKRRSTWKFAIVQAVPWFSASILGSCLSDPLSEFTGRRMALFISALCSFTSSIAGSRVKRWEALVGTRVLLGLGIGGKASIVPVLLSEILPPSKRGRLLVSWQVFDAAGILFGSIACYILRHSWRNQILSGAIPAFALLMVTFASCESPRWLIIRGRYPMAFTTLLRLRKERRLALKELVSIHYQTQAERRLFIRRDLDDESGPGISPFETELGRTSWWERFRNMFYIHRIRRAAIAAMIVMICQQFSGINIYGFLATQFYSTAGPASIPDYPSANCSNGIDATKPASEICRSSNATEYYTNWTCNDTIVSFTTFPILQACEEQTKNEDNSYIFAIGFGAANMIFSCLAYFLVENKEHEDADNKLERAVKQITLKVSYFFRGNKRFKGTKSETNSPDDVGQSTSRERSKDSDHSSTSQASFRHIEDSAKTKGSGTHDKFPEYKEAPKFRGRRFLLLMSFAAGIVTLLLTSMMFNIPDDSNARTPMIIFFIIVFTAFYSPGAGAVPFLYCAEIFPNEGRELGMSWSTFWNFLGAGVVALLVPFGINWGHSRLLGLFSGLNALAFVLVWFCVYSTNHTTTLEDYSYVFGRRMRDHMWRQAQRLWYWSDERAPRWHWENGVGAEEKTNEKNNDDEKTKEKNDGEEEQNTQPQQDVPVLPHIPRVSTTSDDSSSSRGEDDVG